LPINGLLLTVEEVRAATSTTGGQQMGQHGDKAEDEAAQDGTTEERRGQAVEDRARGGRRAKKRYQVALHTALLPYLDLSIECNKCASCLGQNSFSFIKGNIRSNRNKLTIK
jgi:hypothetical protein